MDFVELMLRGIRFAKDFESTSAALDQGKETTRANEEVIAEYAGIPSVGIVEKMQHGRTALMAFAFGWGRPAAPTHS